MRIRAAHVTELPALQAIERAAGRMFRDIGMPEIAQYDPWPLPVMAARHDAGRLWVAAGAANRAAADGLPALTLTTFAHVPWNAPY